jgi:hypothetical protein
VVPAVSSAAAAAAAAAAGNAADLFALCHSEELREAMFQLVKSAQQQQQQQRDSSKSIHRMQALLLKWLLLNIDIPGSCRSTDVDHTSSSGSGSSSSSSRPRGSAHFHSSILPGVLAAELHLLTAQLAVKLKRWRVAQAVTDVLQQQLVKVVRTFDLLCLLSLICVVTPTSCRILRQMVIMLWKSAFSLQSTCQHAQAILLDHGSILNHCCMHTANRSEPAL